MYLSRRRRANRSQLYTGVRCDPEPWQGSPPQTPPSSDDENEIPSIMNKESVKTKISKYIKAQNENLLPSQQYIKYQKKQRLNVTKTAPVPFINKDNDDEKTPKTTAPAPIMSHLLNSKKPKESKLSNKIRGISIPERTRINDETLDESPLNIPTPDHIDIDIDFDSIPEAYYIGHDTNIDLLSSDDEQLSRKNTDIDTLEFDLTLIDDDNLKTNDDEGEENEVALYSPTLMSATNSSSKEQYGYNIMGDFSNSEMPTPENEIIQNNEILNSINIEMELEEESLDEIKVIEMTEIEDGDKNEEVYFNDDKFILLAEQILDEKTVFDQNQININYLQHQAQQTTNHNNNNSQHHYQQQHFSIFHQPNNIWTEPVQYQSYGSYFNYSSQNTCGQ